MTHPEVKRLKDEAGRLAQAGLWRDALEVYLQLCQLEPNSGVWLLRAGEMYRKLGNDARAIAAFDRAVEVYSTHGFRMKAIAVCKLILEMDPGRQRSVERLAALEAAIGGAGGNAAAPVAAPASEPPAVAADVEIDVDFADGHAAPESVGKEDSGAIELDADEDLELIEEGAEEEEEITEPRDVEPLLPERDGPEQEVARSVLPKTPLFSTLDELRLKQVIQAVRLVEIAAGEVVFRQGVRGDALYVVAEGEVAVLNETPAGERELARLGGGAFFGEIALFTAQPRNATVRAVSATRLLALDRAIVMRMCGASSDFKKVLLRFVRDRLLSSLMETSPLLTPFTPDERFSLVERFEFQQIEEGTTILHEGKRAPGLFIILSGRAVGTIEGNQVLELSPGDIMGEVSLLTNGTAIATVRAQSRVLALQLPRREFQDVIMTHPQVLEYASSVMEERRQNVDAWREGKAVFREGRLQMI